MYQEDQIMVPLDFLVVLLGLILRLIMLVTIPVIMEARAIGKLVGIIKGIENNMVVNLRGIKAKLILLLGPI